VAPGWQGGVHGLERLDGDLGVDLRGRQKGVTQHLLHVPDVGPALEHQGGRGVAEGVAAAPPSGAGGHVAAHQAGEVVGGDVVAIRAEEQHPGLVVEGVAHRPLHVADHGLGERLVAIGELDDGDRTSLLTVFDALITKSRVKALAGGVS
jgi:hypothetical protein